MRGINSLTVRPTTASTGRAVSLGEGRVHIQVAEISWFACFIVDHLTKGKALVHGLEEVAVTLFALPQRFFCLLALQLSIQALHGEGNGRCNFLQQGNLLVLKDIGFAVVNRQRAPNLSVEADRQGPLRLGTPVRLLMHATASCEGRLQSH